MTNGENENRRDASIEAVLFACGKPVSLAELCCALDLDRSAVSAGLERLERAYEEQRRGVCLLRLENSFQLCSCERFAPQIRKALRLSEPPPLSRSALEVLLIVANYQPTTQRFIDGIRGADSSYWIDWLLEHGLLEPYGRLERRGQPNAYATTLEFLRMFHFRSLADVPELGGSRDPAREAARQLPLDELGQWIS